MFTCSLKFHYITNAVVMNFLLHNDSREVVVVVTSKGLCKNMCVIDEDAHYYTNNVISNFSSVVPHTETK